MKREENVFNNDEYLFYYKTFLCNKLTDIMKGEKVSHKEVDRIINNKFNNVLEDKENMDKDILENNLFVSSNDDFLYTVNIEFEEEVYDEKFPYILAGFSTNHTNVFYKDPSSVVITHNCRNKAEIYTVFRALKKYKLEFEELIICAYVKEDSENRNFFSSRVSFDVDKVYELADDYNFDIIKYMNKKDCEFIGLRAIYRLTVPWKLFSFMSYGIYLSGLDMINLASTLYEIVEKNYKAYCVLFSYILLYRNEKNIQAFLKKITSDPDESIRERVIKIVEAAEELGIFDIHDSELGYLSDMVNMKIRELILNDKYSELNDVIALVDSAYIGTMTTAHSEETSSYDKSSN